MSGFDDSVGDDLDKPLSDSFVLVLQKVRNLSCLNFKQAHLNFLDYLFLYFDFPVQIQSYLFLNLLNFFCLVFLNIFQVFIDIHQQKLLIHIVLTEIFCKRLNNLFKILLK